MSALDEAINTIAALRERVQWLESKARAHEMVLVDERAKTREAARAFGLAVKEAAALRERVATLESQHEASLDEEMRVDAENERLRAELAARKARVDELECQVGGLMLRVEQMRPQEARARALEAALREAKEDTAAVQGALDASVADYNAKCPRYEAALREARSELRRLRDCLRGEHLHARGEECADIGVARAIDAALAGEAGKAEVIEDLLPRLRGPAKAAACATCGGKGSDVRWPGVSCFACPDCKGTGKGGGR